MVQAKLVSYELDTVPRSIGRLKLSSKKTVQGSGIDRFQTSGSSKVAFPRRSSAVEGIMLNTSGGLTGGDRFETFIDAGSDSRIVLTTQAAERAYRSISDVAKVRAHLTVAKNAVLHWLPQELIVFDGAAIDRHLTLDVADDAEAVVIEPVVFGRIAMSETRLSGTFDDRITLRRNGVKIYWDRVHFCGSISDHLNRPAVAGGRFAVASGYYVGPRAEALRALLCDLLPETGGASLISPDLLVMRVLAPDSFSLRQTLIPVIEQLTQSTLPKSWSL